MKKITVLAFLTLLLNNAFSQRKPFQPNYFTQMDANVDFGKKNNGTAENNFELKGQGVYEWFYWKISRRQPFTKNSSTEYLEKMTGATAGYGRISHIGESSKLVWGIGVSAMLTPYTSTIPKKNDLYWGGSLNLNFESESANCEFEGGISYLVLPPSSNTDWGHSVFTPELKAIKFFGENFGVGATYKMQLFTEKERQVENIQFNGTINGQSKTEINGFLCGKIKWARLEFGPLFKRTKNSWSTQNQPKNFYAESKPTAWKVSLIVTLANRKY